MLPLISLVALTTSFTLSSAHDLFSRDDTCSCFSPEASTFANSDAVKNAATGATTPSGYINTGTNGQAWTPGQGSLGFVDIDNYDSSICAGLCDTIRECSSFQIYFEPGKDGKSQVKCAFWGGIVDSSNANYNISNAIGGINTYTSNSVVPPSGYDAPKWYGNSAFDYNSPDVSGLYIGSQVFSDGSYDTSRCADKVKALGGSFYNTYLLHDDSGSAQHCDVYSGELPSGASTWSGKPGPKGNSSISNSFTCGKPDDNDDNKPSSSGSWYNWAPAGSSKSSAVSGKPTSKPTGNEPTFSFSKTTTATSVDSETIPTLSSSTTTYGPGGKYPTDGAFTVVVNGTSISSHPTGPFSGGPTTTTVSSSSDPATTVVSSSTDSTTYTTIVTDNESTTATEAATSTDSASSSPTSQPTSGSSVPFYIKVSSSGLEKRSDSYIGFLPGSDEATVVTSNPAAFYFDEGKYLRTDDAYIATDPATGHAIFKKTADKPTAVPSFDLSKEGVLALSGAGYCTTASNVYITYGSAPANCNAVTFAVSSGKPSTSGPSGTPSGSVSTNSTIPTSTGIPTPVDSGKPTGIPAGSSPSFSTSAPSTVSPTLTIADSSVASPSATSAGTLVGSSPVTNDASSPAASSLTTSNTGSSTASLSSATSTVVGSPAASSVTSSSSAAGSPAVSSPTASSSTSSSVTTSSPAASSQGASSAATSSQVSSGPAVSSSPISQGSSSTGSSPTTALSSDASTTQGGSSSTIAVGSTSSLSQTQDGQSSSGAVSSTVTDSATSSASISVSSSTVAGTVATTGAPSGTTTADTVSTSTEAFSSNIAETITSEVDPAQTSVTTSSSAVDASTSSASTTIGHTEESGTIPSTTSAQSGSPSASAVNPTGVDPGAGSNGTTAVVPAGGAPTGGAGGFPFSMPGMPSGFSFPFGNPFGGFGGAPSTSASATQSLGQPAVASSTSATATSDSSSAVTTVPTDSSASATSATSDPAATSSPAAGSSGSSSFGDFFHFGFSFNFGKRAKRDSGMKYMKIVGTTLILVDKQEDSSSFVITSDGYLTAEGLYIGVLDGSQSALKVFTLDQCDNAICQTWSMASGGITFANDAFATGFAQFYVGENDVVTPVKGKAVPDGYKPASAVAAQPTNNTTTSAANSTTAAPTSSSVPTNNTTTVSQPFLNTTSTVASGAATTSSSSITTSLNATITSISTNGTASATSSISSIASSNTTTSLSSVASFANTTTSSPVATATTVPSFSNTTSTAAGSQATTSAGNATVTASNTTISAASSATSAAGANTTVSTTGPANSTTAAQGSASAGNTTAPAANSTTSVDPGRAAAGANGTTPSFGSFPSTNGTNSTGAGNGTAEWTTWNLNSTSAMIDAYKAADVIYSMNLTGFCSTLLGYTTPVVTATVTATATVNQSSTLTYGTLTSGTTDTYTTLPTTITITQADSNWQRIKKRAAQAAIVTPAPLATYNPDTVSTACGWLAQPVNVTSTVFSTTTTSSTTTIVVTVPQTTVPATTEVVTAWSTSTINTCEPTAPVQLIKNPSFECYKAGWDLDYTGATLYWGPFGVADSEVDSTAQSYISTVASAQGNGSTSDAGQASQGGSPFAGAGQGAAAGSFSSGASARATRRMRRQDSSDDTNPDEWALWTPQEPAYDGSTYVRLSPAWADGQSAGLGQNIDNLAAGNYWMAYKYRVPTYALNAGTCSLTVYINGIAVQGPSTPDIGMESDGWQRAGGFFTVPPALAGPSYLWVDFFCPPSSSRSKRQDPNAAAGAAPADPHAPAGLPTADNWVAPDPTIPLVDLDYIRMGVDDGGWQQYRGGQPAEGDADAAAVSADVANAPAVAAQNVNTGVPNFGQGAGSAAQGAPSGQ